MFREFEKNCQTDTYSWNTLRTSKQATPFHFSLPSCILSSLLAVILETLKPTICKVQQKSHSKFGQCKQFRDFTAHCRRSRWWHPPRTHTWPNWGQPERYAHPLSCTHAICRSCYHSAPTHPTTQPHNGLWHWRVPPTQSNVLIPSQVKVMPARKFSCTKNKNDAKFAKQWGQDYLSLVQSSEREHANLLEDKWPVLATLVLGRKLII